MITIEITKRGIYRPGGMIPVGTRLTMAQEPQAWSGKYRVIGMSDGKRLEVAEMDGVQLRKRYEEVTGKPCPPRIGRATLLDRISQAEARQQEYDRQQYRRL